jgi:hypothetical protein
MVLSRRFEPPDLVAATLVGVVTSSDQAELVTFVRATIPAVGSVRVLLRLEQFAGWNPDAAFDRESLWLRDDEGVSRIAVVGDPEWRGAVLTLMTQPVRRVPIEYFATEAAARAWLERTSRRPAHAAST